MMPLFAVRIFHKLDTHHVNQRARYHEEAAQQALLGLGLTEGQIDGWQVEESKPIAFSSAARRGTNPSTPEIAS